MNVEERIKLAYADEALRIPQDALPRILRRQRLRLCLVAGLAAMASVGGITVAVRAASPLRGPEGQAASQVEEPADVCHRLGTERLRDARYTANLADNEKVMPAEVVTFADKGQWMNLYLAHRFVLHCAGPYGGSTAEAGTEPEVDVQVHVSGYADRKKGVFDGEFMNTWSFSYQKGQAYVIVAAPKGTERLDVVLGDGTTVKAKLVDGLAVAWMPRHSAESVDSEKVKIQAYTKGTVYTKQDGETTSQPRTS